MSNFQGNLTHTKFSGKIGSNPSYTKKPSNFKKIEVSNPIDDEITNWVYTITETNTGESIEIYESKKYSWLDRKQHMLKILVRNHKSQVLEYVLDDITHMALASPKQSEQVNFTLLNEAVWFNSSDIQKLVNPDFEKIKLDIINTMLVLISHGHNFISLSSTENVSSKSEIENMIKRPIPFYLSVVKRDKRIPSELQNNLYHFITVKMNLKKPELFEKTFESNGSFVLDIKKIINEHFAETNTQLKRFETSESFLGAILNQYNRINPILRENLYRYFTSEYYDGEHFKTCIKLIFNKITESNSLLFTDNILFILSRNTYEISQEICKLLISRELTGITEKKIIETILSVPTGKVDYAGYFDTIDIELVKTRFLENVIENFNQWVEDTILLQKTFNPEVEDNEFRTNNLGVVMMILGIGYSRRYIRKSIIDTIFTMFDTYSQIKLIKPFGVFLETSGINSENLDSDEYELVTKFIKSYYLSDNFKDKVNIENILGNFVTNSQNNLQAKASDSKSTTLEIRKKNIDTFLNKGCFFLKKVSRVVPLKYFPDMKNGFNCLEDEQENEEDDQDDEQEDDQEDDQEDVQDDDQDDDQEEFPEPNEKIIKNLQLYFKSNDEISKMEDLIYFITTDNVTQHDFSYGLYSSLIERKLSDIVGIKTILEKLSELSGFEKIEQEFILCHSTYPGLIEMMKCDNPKISQIVLELFN
jgi:hypothetical protein